MPDMKLSSEERKDFCTPEAMQAPKYPHGLSLRLGPEELEKLGIQDAPSLDQKMSFTISAVVKEIEKEEEEGDEGKFRLCLQITEMDKIQKDKSASEALYGA